jgi:MFS family permease
VLGLLTVVYAFNIADRFSISTLIEPIRAELRLSDAGIAFLTGGALAVFYVTVGIPVAALADRANRRNILAVSLAAWSAMTALCGLAHNRLQLTLARFGVGIGEAGGTPPSTSILADKFPPSRRPMALTVFALGACLGAWLGSSVAGTAAERGGWRAAFLVLGIPGVVLALIVWLTVREPRRGQLDAGGTTAAHSTFLATLRYLAAQRSALHLLVRRLLRRRNGVTAVGVAVARAHWFLGRLAPVDQRTHDPRGRGTGQLKPLVGARCPVRSVC